MTEKEVLKNSLEKLKYLDQKTRHTTMSQCLELFMGDRQSVLVAPREICEFFELKQMPFWLWIDRTIRRAFRNPRKYESYYTVKITDMKVDHNSGVTSYCIEKK